MKATRREPRSVEAFYGLATASFRVGDLVAARSQFERVEQLQPLHAGAAANLRRGLLSARGFGKGGKLLRGDQLDPKRAENYYNLGLVYRKQGRIGLAIQMYQEAFRRNPRMVDAAFNLANIHFESGDLLLARSFYQQVLEQVPTFFRATVGLERIERRLKNQALAGPKSPDEIYPPLGFPITSFPMNGTNADGTRTVPSAC